MQGITINGQQCGEKSFLLTEGNIWLYWDYGGQLSAAKE